MRNLKLIRSCTRAAVLSGLTLALLTGAARAEPSERAERSAADARPAKHDGVRPGMAFERMKQFLADLDLSVDQKAKLEPILKDARAQGLALMSDAKSMQPRDRIMKLADLLSGTREKIKAELTPEQTVKFESKLKEMRGRIAERVGEAGLGGRLKDALAKLDLTPEQKQKADAIFEEAKSRIIDARTSAADKSTEALDDAREKGRTILKEAREKLTAVLTPEQMNELRESMQSADGPRSRKPGDASVEPRKTR